MRHFPARYWLFVILGSLLLSTSVAHAEDIPTDQPFPLSAHPAWEAVDVGNTSDLAWGDVDGDGDLDLAVGNISALSPFFPDYDGLGRPNYLYLNEGGQLSSSAVWRSPAANSWSLAWGDVDRDGDLDLAVGNDGANHLYLNRDGRLESTPAWASADGDVTRDLALADVNGDGWFDLVAGNENSDDKVYLNRRGEDGLLFPATGDPIADSAGLARVRQLTDLNSDGVLDLLAVERHGYRVYTGTGDGRFTHQLSCTSSSSMESFWLWPTTPGRDRWTAAIGLSDGPGSNVAYSVYTHSFYQPLSECLPGIWAFDGLEVLALPMTQMTPADVNGDGRLDLTTAWGVYMQAGPAEAPDFAPRQHFPHELAGDPSALAWADVDGDGDLDLALAFEKQPVRLFLNHSDLHVPADEIFGSTPLPGQDRDFLAWADVDNDGDYDLLSALSLVTAPVELRRNQSGILAPPQPLPDSLISPSSFDSLDWNDIPAALRAYAWGDMDGDGLVDLALAIRYDRTVVYRNTGAGDQPFQPVWRSDRGGHSVAWGDVDQDGDLDLAVGRVNEDLLFRNEGGALTAAASWAAREWVQSDRLLWQDVDADGDVDLIATTDRSTTHRLYRNDDGALRPDAVGLSTDLFWQRLDFAASGDGQRFQASADAIRRLSHRPVTLATPLDPPPLLSFIEPGKLAPAHPAALTRYNEGGQLSIAYTFSGPEGSVYDIYGYFSLDSGLTWQSSSPTPETPTRGLESGSHTYTWDYYADGLVGPNDDVRFRLQLRPSLLPPPHGQPGPYEIPYVEADTLTFRVFGKQARVVWPDETPVADAVVFRRTASGFGPAQIIRDNAGIPASTSSSGYLSGRTPLLDGDQLIALSPVPTDTVHIPFTDRYTLFYTSGSPTEEGMETREVDAGGVQTLTLSTDNRLLLFHLNVSLEWDARNDSLFLQQLEESFQQASALLYDVTNGQVALGQVNLFHSKAYWGSADIAIHADNGLRPSAAIGGIVNRPVSETLADGTTVEAAYLPGQIQMGTVWDPYGERTAELGDEWSRALAHELAHYLFFLPDNYLGFAGDVLRRITCPDSFMTTSSDLGFSEFLDQAQWLEERRSACLDSLAQRTTGRSDWKTIEAFYGDVLHFPPASLSGPATLPLAVTRLVPWALAPVGMTALPALLPSRNFDLRDDRSQRQRLPDGRAYLIKTQGTDDLSDDVLIGLGNPTGGGDRLKVRGAEVGDRLCLFAPEQSGCVEQLGADSAALVVSPTIPGWNPQISVRSITSRTLALSVEQANVGELGVQIYPMHYSSLSGAAAMGTLHTEDGHTHTAELTLGLPAFAVALRVWATDHSGRESITTVRLTPPSWGPFPMESSETVTVPEQYLAYAPTGGPINVPIGGPINVPIGGPINVPIGGPINVPIGGPINVPIGGPINVPIGGPINVPIGGPINVPIGGTSREQNAPILSADSQVVVYSAEGFFADNGVETIQILGDVPLREQHPWLVPVGPAYRVSLAESASRRFISFSYLQRDVPDGYEYALAVYFLPDGADRWVRVEEGEAFVENLIVAELQADGGVYAVMASIALPPLQPGWNLLTYPLPDSRPVADALSSIIEQVDGIEIADYPVAAPVECKIGVEQLEFGRVYWVHISGNTPVIPYLAPPVRQPDGTLRDD